MKPIEVIIGSGWTIADGETAFECRIIMPIETRPKSIAKAEGAASREEFVAKLKAVLEHIEVQ